MSPFLVIALNFILALGWLAQASAQPRPIVTDEKLRMLGGDPDKDRADAAKNALERATPEEMDARLHAFRLMKTLTDESIRSISSDDPLLMAIYMNRMGDGSAAAPNRPWLEVIDRDIRRRPEAQALLQNQFRKPRPMVMRAYLMQWLVANPDVPWGNDLMEEAILSYRADPKKWNYAEIWGLCRLIQLRGNESHLAFLDEVNTEGGGDHGTSMWLRERLEEEKNKTLLPPRSMTGSVNQKIGDGRETTKVPVQGHEPSDPKFSASVRWAVVIGVITAGLGFLALLLKRRAK